MTGCDTLLMIGSGFPYSEFLPKEGKARGVQIDIEPDMLSLRYPMEVNLVGDAAETLRALLPLLNAEDRTRVAREHREQRDGVVEDAGGARHAARPIRSIRSASPGSCRRGCPTGPSSPAIRAPAPTGTRAISKIRRGMMARCPAVSPRWARRCRTRSPRSSRIPIGR